MKVQTIRENTEPFGTEYSCMMAILIEGKLVVVRSDSEEFNQVKNLILSSKKLAPKGIAQEASEEDLKFFSAQVKNSKQGKILQNLIAEK